MADAPNEQYIQSLKGTLETLFRAEDEQIDEMRHVRMLEEPVPLDDELRTVDVEVRDPTITDEIARVVATLTVNPSKLQVTPAGLDDDSIENATLREHWTEEVLKIAGNREPGIPTGVSALDATVGDGGGWTKLLFTPDTWEARYGMKVGDFQGDTAKFDDATEEAKKDAGPPFIWKNVDVRSIYPLWEGSRLTEVVEVTKRPALPLFRKYGLKLDRGRILPAVSQSESVRSAIGEIDHIEHWDDTYCTYILMNGKSAKQVYQFEHGYGQVPYFFSPGLMPSFWKGRKVGWGVSQSKLWLVRFKSFLLTMVAQDAAKELGKPVGIETPDAGLPLMGPDGKPLTRMEWNIGDMFQLNSGQKFVEFPTRPITPALKELLTYISDIIEHLDSPKSFGNINDVEGGSGFGINQVLTEAKTKHNPFAQHYEKMMEEVTRFLWHLVKTKVKEKVWVRQSLVGEGGKKYSQWLAAGPDDLGQGVGITWHLDPLTASSKIIEERYWDSRVKNGSASQDMAIEAMGDNPDEVRRGRAYDRIRASQAYMQYEDKQVFEEGMSGDIISQVAAQIAASGSLPGQEKPNPLVPPAGGGEVNNNPGAPMGSGGTPVHDMADLAQSPDGQGGGTSGVGAGAVVPALAATAGVGAGML